MIRPAASLRERRAIPDRASRKPILSALLILLLSSPLAATQIRRLSLVAIRDAASAVLVIDVIGSIPRLGRAGMVWTDYQVRIAQVLRGRNTAGDVLTLSFAGGQTGGVDVGIAGVPTLDRGSRYVIFVDDVSGRPVPAIGWSQGIFHVGEKSETGLVSLDGDQLLIDRGTLVRRPLAAVTGQGRIADPVVANADGSTIAEEAHAGTPSTALRSSKRATLDDLRHFVEHSMAEPPSHSLPQ